MGYRAHLLFGPPGIGKGTAGDYLIQVLPLEKIATGDLVREAKQESHLLWPAMKAKLDVGELVEDDHIFILLEERLTSLPYGKQVLFDGFPRTLNQAEYLNGIADVRCLYNFTIEPETVRDRQLELRRQKRVEERAKQGLNPRDDDTYEAFWNRVTEFFSITHKVLDHYQARSVPIEDVNALPSAETVALNIALKLRERL